MTVTIDGTTGLYGPTIPRLLTITTNTATPAINTNDYEFVVITGQSTTITSFAMTGTPVTGQKLWISITGATAAVSFTFQSALFEASTVALPTTTVGTNRLDVGFIWNGVSSKWRCVGAI